MNRLYLFLAEKKCNLTTYLLDEGLAINKNKAKYKNELTKSM